MQGICLQTNRIIHVSLYGRVFGVRRNSASSSRPDSSEIAWIQHGFNPFTADPVKTLHFAILVLPTIFSF